MTFSQNFDAVLDGARLGDDHAWARLYGEMAGPVMGFLRSRGVADAEAATGDVFTELVGSVEDFEGSEDAFRTLVFQIAYRRFLAEKHYSMSPARSPLADQILDHPVVGVPAADAGEVPEDLRRAYAVLTPAQRDAFSLRIVAGLTLDQTAEVIDVDAEVIEGHQKDGLANVNRSLGPTIGVEAVVASLATYASVTPSVEFVAFQARQAAATINAGSRPPASPSDMRETPSAGIRRQVAALATSLAMVSGMTGLAWAADDAVPGDWYYGIDQALEQIGVGAGGAEERLLELQATAPTTADTASSESVGPQLASDVVTGHERGSEVSARVHSQVSMLLSYLADVEAVDGAVIAELAKALGERRSNAPDDAGRPEDAGRPDDPGKPDNPGKP